MSTRRRGHGKGSIYKRPGGRWVARIELEWADGREGSWGKEGGNR